MRTGGAERRASITTVIPAKAGIHSPVRSRQEPMPLHQWIPAFAGMTTVMAGGARW